MLSRTGQKRHPLADASGKLPVVVQLPIGKTAREAGFQPFAPGLGVVKVRPRRSAPSKREHTGLGYSIWPPFHAVLDRSAILNRTLEYRQRLRATGSPVQGIGEGTIVGIVDTGIDVTHPDFRDATGHTRIAWLLDLSHPPIHKHPELEAAFGCDDPAQTPCAVLESVDVDEAWQEGSSTSPSTPSATARTSRRSLRAMGGETHASSEGRRDVTLIVAGVSDNTGSVADADIAAGARFVFERADELGLPAVVNLSLGGDFGPHDGTAPVEKALAAGWAPLIRGEPWWSPQATAGPFTAATPRAKCSAFILNCASPAAFLRACRCSRRGALAMPRSRGPLTSGSPTVRAMTSRSGSRGRATSKSSLSSWDKRTAMAQRRAHFEPVSTIAW